MSLRTSPGLIGRTSELNALKAVVEGACEGQARGILLHGAPGAGKTRLLAVAANEAASRGIRVARSSCLPLTTPLPFDPVLELLRSVGQPLPAIVIESPHELFGIVVDRLERTTMDGPLVLCLDDLQWSDAGTIELVYYCLARLTDLPIAWLLASRPLEAVERLAHRLERASVLEQIELDALSAAEVGQLAKAMLGERISDELEAVLYARTRGNPFLCEELLRALGDVATPLGSSNEGFRELERLVPGSVSAAIEERTSRLAATAREALIWAAVLPEPFTAEELQAVCGDASGSTLESLAAASFLSGDDRGRWSFVHAIVRDAVYHRLPDHERVRRHSLIADSLVDGPPERQAPQLASARRWRDAATAYLRLARSALDRGRGTDALELYQRSETLASEGGDERLLRDSLVGKVLALVRAGQTDQAAEMARVLRSELRADDQPNERLAFLSRYAMALIEHASDTDGAQEVLREAAPLLAQVHGRALAEVLVVRALVLMAVRDFAGALPDAERAAELAELTDDLALLTRALNAFGIAVGVARSLPTGVATLERGVTVARAAELPTQEAVSRLCLSSLALVAGDLSSAEANARQGLELGDIPPNLAILLRGNLSDALLRLGDSDTALAHALAALREAAILGPQVQATAATTLGYVYLHRGDLSALRLLLENDAAAFDGVDTQRTAELWGRLLEAEGAPAQALARFTEATYELDSPAPECVAGMARTAVAVGDLRAARDALARLEVLTERWPLGEWQRSEAEGWVAVGENRPEDAVAHFRAAATGCSRIFDAARLDLEAALLEMDHGQVRSAIEAFERIGAERAADHARAVARSLGMRPGRRRAAAGALSAREEEIAQLVAAGHTNAEIAAMLYLSPRTVEHHISAILAKLGYRSRVQIASEAAAGRLPGARGAAPSPR